LRTGAGVLAPLPLCADGGTPRSRRALERINVLADRPQFYHLLSNNCTVNIVGYASGGVGTTICTMVSFVKTPRKKHEAFGKSCCVGF
jgi:hypothetical protein